MTARHIRGATRQSRGFSVIAGVLAILVAVLVGVGGWYIWQKNHQDTSKHPSASSLTHTKTSTQSDPSEGGKYLFIKEWGVRFPLPEALKGDVKYGIFTFKNGDQAAYFASKAIASKSAHGACDLHPVTDSSGQGIFGGTIAVGRSTTQPETVDQRSFEQSGYWYAITPSNGGACYDGDTGQERGQFNSQLEPAIRELAPAE
jgi:hypothetical protein